MYQQITEASLNLKHHRDIYQDDNHALMIYEHILVANCVRSLNIKVPLSMQMYLVD